MMEEIWKPVLGWEGLYEVSDLGRVRSLDRIIQHRKNGPTKYKGRVLRQGKSKNGYCVVVLTKNMKMKCQNVHVLVLRAFRGKAPIGMVGCHFDDDGFNNTLTNLRWDSYSANGYDRERNRRAA